jgi:hypothetical protein
VTRAYDFMPGVPAAGHIAGGYWHPGPAGENCAKCAPAPGSEAAARHFLTARRAYGVAAGSTLDRARANPGRYAYTPDGACWVIVRPGRRWEADDSTRAERRAAHDAHPAVHPRRLIGGTENNGDERS